MRVCGRVERNGEEERGEGTGDEEKRGKVSSTAGRVEHIR